ncbi:21 kDa seed protein [Gossypium raimondii]|nr:21 kDa seed protein [Gossypium raimondii]
MKTTTASVFLLFIIFSITPLSFSFGVANTTNAPVLDSDGNELRTGTPYFVVSSIWGAGGGGLALGMPRGNPCPEVVAQRGSGDDGIPVIFSNSDSNDGVVRLSSDINIEFIPLRPRFCQTTTVWKVDDYDHSAGKWWVITDGVKGNPGANTLTSWFRIEKASHLDYTFKYCPAVCGTCPALCNKIARDLDGEMMRLALSTDHGWPFFFKKLQTSAMEIEQVVHN